MRCVHATDDPKGCGFGPACETCGVRNAVVDTFRTGKPNRGEVAHLPYEAENGPADLWVIVSTSCLEFADEDMVLVCLHDITQRKRAEEAIRESEERFRLI